MLKRWIKPVEYGCSAASAKMTLKAGKKDKDRFSRSFRFPQLYKICILYNYNHKNAGTLLDGFEQKVINGSALDRLKTR